MFILTKIIIEVIERNKFDFYVKLWYNDKGIKFLVPFETSEALVVSNKIKNTIFKEVLSWTLKGNGLKH